MIDVLTERGYTPGQIVHNMYGDLFRITGPLVVQDGLVKVTLYPLPDGEVITRDIGWVRLIKDGRDSLTPIAGMKIQMDQEQGVITSVDHSLKSFQFMINGRIGSYVARLEHFRWTCDGRRVMLVRKSGQGVDQYY